MAAVAHNESLADDEILRRADALKKAVSDANTRDKIPAFDRSALDTQEWRPVVFECIELLVWRLLDEHGEVLDEGPDCPGAGFSIRFIVIAFYEQAFPVFRACGAENLSIKVYVKCEMPSHFTVNSR